MGFRFQKRIKLLPGITINLSKSGVSTSFGVTGARVTYGHGRKRVTTGIPGTGISHTTVTKIKQQPSHPTKSHRSDLANIAIVFAITIFLLLLIGVHRY